MVDKQGDEMLKLIKNQKEQLAKDMQAQLQDAKVNNSYPSRSGDWNSALRTSLDSGIAQ